MENTFGMTEVCTKENGTRIKLMVKESMSGLMVESMMVNGEIITCMEEESIPGKMEECMRVTMKMIVNMDMEYTHGTTENNMKAGGKTENSMEKEFIEKMVVIDAVSGKMERELNGWMMLNGMISKTLVILIEIIKKYHERTIN